MKKLFIITILLVTLSCSKDIYNPESEPLPEEKITEVNGYQKISYEEAYSIAETASSYFEDEQTKGQKKTIAGNSIISATPTLTKSNETSIDTLLYVFNYANDEGYVVIPSNNVNGQIVAYIEQGNFNIQDTLESDLSKMLVHLMINNQLRANAIYEASLIATKNPFGIMETIPVGPMCRYTEFPEDVTYPAPAPPGPGDDPNEVNNAARYGCYRSVNKFSYTTVYNKTPLLTTTWNQGTPYNDQAKLINGSKAWSGCVAIAVSQIMAYHAHPTTYPNTIINTLVPSNFHSYAGKNTTLISLRNIKDFTKEGSFAAKDHVSRFIAIIGYMLNNNWGLSATSASSENIPTVMYKFGYNMPSKVDYDVTLVKNSLTLNKPLYISGSRISNQATGETKGHAWVLDGYKTLKWRVDRYGILFDSNGKFTKTKYISTGFADDEYIHCDFGWGGSSNGYYGNGVFDTSNPQELTDSRKIPGKLYEYNLKIIPNITKR